MTENHAIIRSVNSSEKKGEVKSPGKEIKLLDYSFSDEDGLTELSKDNHRNDIENRSEVAVKSLGNVRRGILYIRYDRE